MNPFRPFARPSLRITLLEDRTVPTTGALGLLDGDALTVVGDDTDNTIILRESDGQLTIDGGKFSTAAGLVDSVPVSAVGLIVIQAGAGNDTVMVEASIRVPTAMTGGDGDDVLVAGGGPTELNGGAGNDSLFGGAGDDRLYAGNGDDQLSGGGGFDIAFGGTGADTFGRSLETRADYGTTDTRTADLTAPQLPPEVAAATPALGAFRQPTELTATLVGDVLAVQGTGGNDIVQLVLADGRYSLADGTLIQTDAGLVASVAASAVRDVTVLGYSGDDVIDLSAAQVGTRVIGGAGADVITGGAGFDLVFGGAGNDTISTGGGDDRVYGDSGDDAITLGAGNDAVYGGAGVDAVDGGDGRDRMIDPAAAGETVVNVEFLGEADPAAGPGGGFGGRPGRGRR